MCDESGSGGSSSLTGKQRPSLTRKIGVGLTRSKLSTGARDPSARLSRELPLTAPRVIISPGSLAPKRTPSDRINSGSSGNITSNSSGYTRYNSDANIHASASSNSASSGSHSVTLTSPFANDEYLTPKSVTREREGKNDVDFNQNKRSSLGIYCSPVIASPSSQLSRDNAYHSQQHIPNSDEQAKVKSERNYSEQVLSDTNSSLKSRNSGGSRWRDCFGSTADTPSSGRNSGQDSQEILIQGQDFAYSRSNGKNYDLDLENDEEDACSPGTSKDSRGKVDLGSHGNLNTNSKGFRSYDLGRNDRPTREIYPSADEPVKQADVISPGPSSPSTSWGYNSPRTPPTASDLYLTPVSSSRSYSDQSSRSNTDQGRDQGHYYSNTPKPQPSQIETMAAAVSSSAPPKRPERTKSLQRKLSGGDLGKGNLTLSPRQPDVGVKSEIKSDQSFNYNGPTPPARGNSAKGRQGQDEISRSCVNMTYGEPMSRSNYNTTDSGANSNNDKDDYGNNSHTAGNESQITGNSNERTNSNQGQSDTARSIVNLTYGEPVPRARPRANRRLTRRNISFKKLEEDEYIGFASLPEQVHRKAVRRGFEFTLMVVGETGLGKSTLINSLFLMDLYKDRKVGNIEERIHKTVDIEKKELEIEERGVKLKLTIVDTPGFNDAVNAEESWKPVVDYIDGQYESYFQAETGLNRKNIQDNRVHCCLYFISPYGHGLRQADIMVMRKLHHKVNIIPLIAKSDMLTKREVKKLKEKILEEIERHKIQIYQYPECDSDEDEEFKHQDNDLKKSIPFAVVGSNTVVEAGGKKIRGRMYPWGIVEVENPLHSDFTKLRQMLISTHMQDLKDVTTDVHYENYRAEHISTMSSEPSRERGKLKRESGTHFESSLETEKLLQEKEAEIRRMQEMLVKMQAQLHTQNSPKVNVNGRVGHV